MAARRSRYGQAELIYSLLDFLSCTRPQPFKDPEEPWLQDGRRAVGSSTSTSPRPRIVIDHPLTECLPPTCATARCIAHNQTLVCLPHSANLAHA
jgi:hypothetical protein